MSCALKLNVTPGFQKTTTIPWPLQVFQELSTSCQDHFLHSTDPTTLNKIIITFDWSSSLSIFPSYNSTNPGGRGGESDDYYLQHEMFVTCYVIGQFLTICTWQDLNYAILPTFRNISLKFSHFRNWNLRNLFTVSICLCTCIFFPFHIHLTQ